MPTIEERVKLRHPLVKRQLGEWAFLRASVEGTPAEYASASLRQYPREDGAIFTARKERAEDLRLGLAKLVLDTYLGYLFQAPPATAEGLGPAVVEFLAKPSASPEEDAISFSKNLAQWVITLGLMWVAVDKPAAPDLGRPLSAQEEADAGLKPYAYLVMPTHVLDAAWGEDGELLWLLVQEDVRDEADPMASTGCVVTRYRLWERHQWRLIEEVGDGKAKTAWQVTQTGPNAIGKVPFVAVAAKAGPQAFSCPGVLGPIAHLDRAAFNLASQLDEVHLQATFPQLAIPLSSNPTDEEAGRALTMGLHSVIPFWSESGPPVWLVANVAAAEELRRGIQDKVNQAKALALLEADAEPGERQPGVSGVSKAYDFEGLNRLLATLADQVEKGMWAVSCLVACWQGEAPPEVAPLDFPERFDVRSLAQEIQDALAVMAASISSPTFTATVAKGLVRKALPKAPSKLLATIDSEIDAGPDAGYDLDGGPEDDEDPPED